MEKVWTVHYQRPLPDPPGLELPRKRYQDVVISFRKEESANTFFEENVKNQPWFDPSVCWVEESELHD